MIGFIQVFSLKDKEKMLKRGFSFLTTQKIGDKTVYVFEYDKMKYDNNSDIKCRITNKLYF